VASHIGYRDIADPVSKMFVHFGFKNSKTLIRRKEPYCGPAVSISEKEGAIV
jgi:hypothetical protein